jgi:sugar/nucleoside kinase (ribokinase family)
VHVPAAADIKSLDPYGAGDAYLAGFTAALVRGADPETALRSASVAASFAVEAAGCQGHTFDESSFTKRFIQAYGESATDYFNGADPGLPETPNEGESP